MEQRSRALRTIDLSERTGLPLGLDEDDLLILGNDLIVADSKVRPFDALTPVALDPESCDGNKGVAYYM